MLLHPQRSRTSLTSVSQTLRPRFVVSLLDFPNSIVQTKTLIPKHWELYLKAKLSTLDTYVFMVHARLKPIGLFRQARAPPSRDLAPSRFGRKVSVPI